MSNGNNQKIEALLKLKDQTWARFDCRRRTQWKTDISIWTVLAAILALIAKGDVPPFTLPMQITATVAGLLLVVLHFLWSVDIGRAFRLDNKTSVSFEKMILEEMQASHGEELTAETDASAITTNRVSCFEILL